MLNVGNQAAAITLPVMMSVARMQPRRMLSRAAAAIRYMRVDDRRLLVMAGKGSTRSAVAAGTTSIENAQTIEYFPNSSIGRTRAAMANTAKFAKLVMA